MYNKHEQSAQRKAKNSELSFVSLLLPFDIAIDSIKPVFEHRDVSLLRGSSLDPSRTLTTRGVESCWWCESDKQVARVRVGLPASSTWANVGTAMVFKVDGEWNKAREQSRTRCSQGHSDVHKPLTPPNPFAPSFELVQQEIQGYKSKMSINNYQK